MQEEDENKKISSEAIATELKILQEKLESGLEPVFKKELSFHDLPTTFYSVSFKQLFTIH